MEFPEGWGGGGGQFKKILPWQGYGYFLEQHIVDDSCMFLGISRHIARPCGYKVASSEKKKKRIRSSSYHLYMYFFDC